MQTLGAALRAFGDVPPSPELVEEERQAAAKAATQAAAAGARAGGHKGESPQKGAKQPPKASDKAADNKERPAVGADAAHTAREAGAGSSGAASQRPSFDSGRVRSAATGLASGVNTARPAGLQALGGSFLAAFARLIELLRPTDALQRRQIAQAYFPVRLPLPTIESVPYEYVHNMKYRMHTHMLFETGAEAGALLAAEQDVRGAVRRAAAH